MSLRLEGKTAIITGAGSGIGQATALAFLDQGANVLAGVYPSGTESDLVERSAGRPGRLATAVADVSTDAGAVRLTAGAMEAFGGIDILVNVAGVVAYGTAGDTTEADWTRQIDVNLKGVWLCTKHALPTMIEQGRGAVVNVASINAIRGNHGLVAYSASKGGVDAMTRAMALDHAAQGVRFNCVCPATIENTGQVDQSFRATDDPAALRRYLLEKHPMGRLGRPEEVAAAIVFLASDEASFITGVTLPIDGGRSIR